MTGPIDARGLVYHGRDREASVEDVLVDAPGPGEVRVRMVAAGVCHSDLHVIDGDWERPAGVVMGHEGAGIVESLGPDVAERQAGIPLDAGGLRVGDLVALAWTAPCAVCSACRRGEGWLCVDPLGSGHRLDSDLVRLRDGSGAGLGAYSGIGTFCSAQVVAQAAAVPIHPQTPVGVAALIGCAATTGVGAIRNTAGVREGESVAIIGMGGVGMSALVAALDAGADPVIAVDIEPSKLAAARSLGAISAVQPDDLVELSAALSNVGFDHVLECIGQATTAELALQAVRPGGTVTLVGMPEMGAAARIEVYEFVEAGIRLQGSNYGSSVPARDFPKIADDVRAGRLPLESLISEEISLDDIAAAFEAMRRRDGMRRIVRFDGASSYS